MWQSHPTTMSPTVEARDRLNIVSYLEEVRGTTDVDRQALYDLLSGILTHEQGVGKMYWQYTQQTTNQELKDRWQKFGKETEAHRRIAEKVIVALDGDPSYKSTIARDHERMMECITPIESQGCAGDHIRLTNLVKAENVSKLLWTSLRRIAVNVKDPSTAKILWDASRITMPTTEEHVNWNSAMYESCVDKLVMRM